MGNFGIQIDDGSKTLSSFVVKNNTKSIELYDWQRRAIKYFFKKDNIAIFEVPTGTGKTYCAIELIKQLLQKNEKLYILIVVPKNIILEKTWFKELYDAGFSLRDIGVYYNGMKEISKITITNMQNVNNLNLEMFDMLVADEVHNYSTPSMIDIMWWPFKYKLGLSATLERIDKKHYNLIKAFNGNKFIYTPQDAFDDGILNPFVFINVGVVMDEKTFADYTKLTEDINLILQLGGGYGKIMMGSSSGFRNRLLMKMNERKTLVNNYKKKFEVVNLLCKKHFEDKVIVFNEYNDQTNKVYWYLLDIGTKACIVHSGIKAEKREQNLIDFKNDKYNVILTSKVLDEGYNLPSLDVAIIAAGNSTAKQTIQRMGRVLRKKDKHSFLYQIYCKNTIEEQYAMERGKLFHSLCSGYNQYTYDKEMVLSE